MEAGKMSIFLVKELRYLELWLISKGSTYHIYPNYGDT